MYKNQLEKFVGSWVTGVQGEAMETSRKIISKALDIKGFMETRKYIIRKPY